MRSLSKIISILLFMLILSLAGTIELFAGEWCCDDPVGIFIGTADPEVSCQNMGNWTKKKQNDAMYGKACVYAATGNIAQACGWLRDTVSNGYNDWKHIKEDKDLDNIRNASCYKEIMNGK